MSTKREIASLYEVVKNYGEGKVLTKALRGISMKILEGDFSVMMVLLVVEKAPYSILLAGWIEQLAEM